MELQHLITRNDLAKAFKKVGKGKKRYSNREFLKFKTDDLNALGDFYRKDKRSENFEQLCKEFYVSNFSYYEYVCVVLPKAGGKFRPLLVPHPRDRVIFSAVLAKLQNKLLPLIDNYLVFGSGKRKDFKNIKEIITEVHKQSLQYKYVLKIDIKAFFPSINRDKLFSAISPHINNPEIIELVRASTNNKIRFVYTFGVGDENKKEEIRESVSGGIPQGCAYSPLLANFYALPLDEVVKNEGAISYRYLDDMIIFLNSEAEAVAIFEKLKNVGLSLDLKIHPIEDKLKNKTYLQKTSLPFEYLGIEVRKDGNHVIPLDKIKKEVALVKVTIANMQTLKKFGCEEVYLVLTGHLKGWRNYYEKNFPQAYIKFKTDNPRYNVQIKEHYLKQGIFLKYLKNKLKTNVDNISLYL
jgi:retron-type reverse transcriptase